MKEAKLFISRLQVCRTIANPAFDTTLLFDAAYLEPKGSAIDEFNGRLHAINTLSPNPASFDALLGQLVLLGVVAAVESYLRTVFRKLIAIDELCATSCYNCEVSFGAACHLSLDLLPEAILERKSFTSLYTIQECMRDLLAIKGTLPTDLKSAVDDYVRICQLRHCAVHRFGKLGASNAISLGLSLHSPMLEKPLRLNYGALQNSIAIASGFVKCINNFLFNQIISRVPDTQWTGKYANDRLAFGRYYGLFADRTSSSKTVAANILYRQFRSQHAKFSAGKPF